VEARDARDLIAHRLSRDGFGVVKDAVSGTQALIARRSQWMFTAKMYEFVVIFVVDGLSGEEAHRLSSAAQSYSIRHKGGLPRGLQTGTLTTVVFVDQNPQESAVEWVDQPPVHRKAALRFVVLIDVLKHEAVYWDGRWAYGWIFRDRTLSLVRQLVLGPLSDTSDKRQQRLQHRRGSRTNDV
jgi:hypothetical protein